MSRLSEILGVKEGQEFRFGDDEVIYRISEGTRQFLSKNVWTHFWDELSLCEMINHPELIHPIPEKPQLTEQQITAIKGRIAEGTLWAARDKDGALSVYPNKPSLSRDQTYFWGGNANHIYSDLYDFITFENSPVYLPDLIGE